jgi:hypothetical protein
MRGVAAMNSRRDFLKCVTLSTAAAAMPSLARVAWAGGKSEAEMALVAQDTTNSVLPPYETRSTAKSGWVPVRVLDTEKMPIISGRGPTGWGRKVLFENKQTGDHLTILYVGPGAEGAPVHYHTFHEWAYNIKGDFTNNESTSPDQHYGPLQRFREGNFLDRPPYSLHGGERGRQSYMKSQVGATILIMEEGDVAGGTFSVEPGTQMKFNPDYKKIKSWSVPRIIDTIDKMPFEPHSSVPGLEVKHLVDDQGRGFRAIIRYLPTGWDSSKSPQSQQFARAYYFKQAYQFNFVIAGDINIQAYKAPGETAEKIDLGTHFYIERAPMSIFGLADGVVTKGGVVWLEVTYGKGTSISNTPIEDPTYV